MIAYSDLRDADRREYLKQHAFLGLVPCWFPLSGPDQFDAIHAAAMQVVPAKLDCDWVQTYSADAVRLRRSNGDGATNSTDLVETILAAVITALFPAAAPVSGLLALGIEFVIELLLSSLQAQFRAGSFGASPNEFANQVHQWALQAAERQGVPR